MPLDAIASSGLAHVVSSPPSVSTVSPTTFSLDREVDDDRELRRTSQDGGDNRGPIGHMLEVVEDKQTRLGGERGEQLVERILVGRKAQPERLRDRLDDFLTRTDVRQGDEEDPVAVFVDHVCSRLDRESCLSGTSRREDGQKPGFAEESLGLSEFNLSANELGQLFRQVVGDRVER